jgi:hypothetical protein
MKLNMILLLIVAIFACVIFWFSPHTFDSARSLYNYLALYFISHATYLTLNRTRPVFTFKLFKCIVYVWFACGIIQLLIDPMFGTFLLPRGGFGDFAVGTSAGKGGRGSTSLAPEPTFYGIICALLMFINYLSFRKEDNYKWLQLLLLVQIFIISRSSTVIMFAMVSCVCYLIVVGLQRKPLYLVYVVILCAISCAFIQFLIPYIMDYRIGQLLAHFMDDPLHFITSDNSVNERFIHTFFSVYGSFDDYLVPHYFGAFRDYMNRLYFTNEFSDIISYFRMNYARIMSGIGGALFELGIIGLFVPYVIISEAFRLYRTQPYALLFSFLFFFILLNAMPLGNGLVGFVLGSMIYYSNSAMQISNH